MNDVRLIMLFCSGMIFLGARPFQPPQWSTSVDHGGHWLGLDEDVASTGIACGVIGNAIGTPRVVSVAVGPLAKLTYGLLRESFTHSHIHTQMGQPRK